MVQGKPDPYKNPATGATRPTNQIGGYEYLQRAEGKSLLETAFDVSKDVVDNPDNYTQAQQDAVPFKSARVGNKDWYDSATYGLELEDNDWGKDSGFFHAKVNDGWEIAFVMLTENNDYFEDNVNAPKSTTNWSDKDSTWFEKLDNLTKDTPIWVQDNAETTDSRACFILVGNDDDYLSVDIDDDVKGISNFQVRIDDTKYVSNAGKIDNETKIGIKWCRRWNPNMPMVDDIPEDKQEDDGEAITEDDVEEESGQSEGDDEDDGDNDDDDGDGGDTEDDDENYSIFLVLGSITLILVGAFVFLRGGRSAE